MSRAADHESGRGSQDGEFLGFSPSPGPDIAGAAARTGHYLWVTARLFEVTGQWAITSTEASPASHFANASSRFAWQADEWRRRLPRLAEVDDQALIRPPSAHAVGIMDRLAATPPRDRPAALAAVIGQLRAVYGSHVAVASPLRDGSALRTLRRIEADLADLALENSDIGHTIGRTDMTFPKP